MINKDTKIYCSFSSNPGNNGCMFFNDAFKDKNINAIYKSFYSDNIEKSMEAVRTLNIRGCAVSMPFKIEVNKFVDEWDESFSNIGSANTIINNAGRLKSYNTDYIGVMDILKSVHSHLYILGNGGFSKAVQYACKLLDIKYTIITRDTWSLIDTLKNETLFNATPIDVVATDNKVIDGRPFTPIGKRIAFEQAKAQFKLYTGIDYE